MPLSSSLMFSWVPGTTDQVRFTTGARTYTVLLKDVQRPNIHSAAALYLKGRVIIQVTAAHFAELTGRLALTMGAYHEPTAVDTWESEGGVVPPPSSRETGTGVGVLSMRLTLRGSSYALRYQAKTHGYQWSVIGWQQTFTQRVLDDQSQSLQSATRELNMIVTKELASFVQGGDREVALYEPINSEQNRIKG